MFARISGKGFPADEIGSRPHDIALNGVWVRDDRSIRGILYISVIKRAPYQNTGFGSPAEKPLSFSLTRIVTFAGSLRRTFRAGRGRDRSLGETVAGAVQRPVGAA